MRTEEVEWLGDCPRCGSCIIQAEVEEDGTVMDGAKVTCTECGLQGEAAVYSAEDVWPEWPEEEDWDS